MQHRQPASGVRAGFPFWSWTADAALSHVSSACTGLTSATAADRLRRDGPNAIEPSAGAGILRLVLRQVESPLVLILIIAAVVAFGLGDVTEATIILAIVLGSTVLGFIQEFRASRAVEALRSRLALTTRVLRDGGETVIPASSIVAGDVIVLSAGNLIPADGLILEASDFLVTEASLTGESFPVEKTPGVLAADAPLAGRTNCIFAGSSVRSGQARALVTQTGLRTAFGAVATRLRDRAPETDFARGLRRFGYLLLRVMIVLVVFVLIINQLLGRPFFESLLFSVALAVGLSPELLPAIVSVTLSAGARVLARRGVLVRRLEAIESLGGVDILCTDKTGTLTEGAIVLKEACDAAGASSDEILQLGFINASLETGIRNPLDEAIVTVGRQKGLAATVRKVDEIPYDFQRKRLTIVVDDGDAATRRLITKGAFFETLAVCTMIEHDGKATPLDTAARAKLEECYQAYGRDGLRALGVATRRLPARDDYTRDDETAMTFVGFLTFTDPPKADARETIAALAAAGVRIKIITGDNRYVAAHCAASMGIANPSILRGEEIDAIRGEAFLPVAERTDVFVEVDPQQKERIVRALQRNGHSIAYLGDGINDAPALHAADVGISVDGAVDVAREAADIILLERDLGVLRQGIQDGRRAFANTLKYICITSGSSFGNMVSMALATPLLPFLPLTATQVLLTNFLTDLPLMAVTTDNVDPEHVEQPQRWSVRDIERFMLVFGLLSSVFDLITFMVLRVFLQADQQAFQTTWFVVSVLTELAALLVLRTRRPVWVSRPGRWLVMGSAFVAVFAVTAPFIPQIAGPLHLAPLGVSAIVAVLAIVVGYALCTEAAKILFYRRKRA
jgi:Mg2+-importing ATPase